MIDWGLQDAITVPIKATPPSDDVMANHYWFEYVVYGVDVGLFARLCTTRPGDPDRLRGSKMQLRAR